MSFRVFISYSTKNAGFRYAVQQKLPAFEYVVDDEIVRDGMPLWETISDNLNSSSCVLAIVTPESLTSHWCIEELTRAHERGLPIIPLCSSDVNEGQMPSFIQKLSRSSFSNNNDLINVLRGRIQPRLNELKDKSNHLVFPKKHFSEIYIALNEIEETNTSVRMRLADAILENCKDELGRASETYTIDLGLERNFLIRAKPIFASAHSVYATSMDSISTFWTSEELRDTAQEYIEAQAQNTIRLFIFKDALSAHLYSQVLEAHHRRYGTTGAVLLCSVESYRCLMRSINADRPDVYDNDFAYIDTGDASLLAKLDGSRLHFHELRVGRKDALFPVNKDRFKAILDEAAKTELGTISENLRVAGRGRVLRWAPTFIDNRITWSAMLKDLFTSGNVSNGYIHQIMFRAGVDFSQINAARNSLLALRSSSDVDFEDVWLGSSYVIDVQDGLYGGRLETGERNDWAYCLIIRFRDSPSLTKYLMSVQHSRIRAKLYSSFSENIANMYLQADELINANQDASSLFERIEVAARPFFHRRDFDSDERIDDIVMKPAIKFID